MHRNADLLLLIVLKANRYYKTSNKKATDVLCSPFEKFLERSAKCESGASDANIFLQSKIFHLMLHAAFINQHSYHYTEINCKLISITWHLVSF